MTEEEKQIAKEKAVLIALKQSMALVRKDLEVYGLRVDGSREFISKSENYDTLWQDALSALESRF